MELIRKVRDGKIEFPVPFEEGEEILIHAEKVPKRHTDRARRFYFGAVIRYIAEEWGQTTNDVSHILTASHFPIEKHNPLTGEVVIIGKSVSVMNTEELMELTTFAMTVAEHLNIKLPTVEEYWEGLTK
jgi:hypothetical protein